MPTDLWLGWLSSPIPSADGIASYPVLDLPSESDYVQSTLYVYGVPNRVGRNVLDGFQTQTEGDPIITKSTRIFTFDYDDPGRLGADEAYLRIGDSGAPSFIIIDGELALAGVHYVNSTGSLPGVDGSISGDTFVPHYIDQLNANMTGEQVMTIVPEPAGGAWILGAVLLLSLRRRVRASVR